MAGAPHVSRRAPLGLSYRFTVAVLYPFMRTMVRWRISGTERLTEADGGIIVAPNHTSWFDPPVVAFAIWTADRPPRFLGKESVFRVPIFGRIIRNAGQIPVYRESADASSAIRDALVALDRGECVVVYPEGTMTRDPDLWPMSGKTGAVRLALASGRPLFPMVQWGTQDVMRPYAKEFRILPRKQVTVVVGEPVDLSDLSGRPVDAEILAEGTDRLMDAITALLAQVRDEPAPATRMDFKRFPDAPVAPHAAEEDR
ncbi:MAG: lysophospholipid acyltransferase family protein [Actinomycetota bacterium]|nr:lysophospholipid acyltransferase family protein [Actinomycetota bacterium]